jgi:leucyl-tRNA synthetase
VLYRFPLEPEAAGLPGSPVAAAGDVAESEATEAFVTDWTGFPSSCALAVHPAHPLSTGLGPGERASFTGRFCRHPLTGDLLPIWVADFVKAEFGTAAVLLNPGHNAPDLEFCRLAGLPVRFSLLAAGHDSSPSSWLNPPFIKQGVAVRSGFADGRPFSEARDVYLAAMASWGLAKEHTDIGMGLFEIASATQDGQQGIPVPWDARKRTLPASSDPAAQERRFAVSPVLSAVEQTVRGAGRLTVVVPSARIESELLALRLVLAEPELGPVAANALEVILCGPALSSKEQVAPDVLRLALLVTAAPLQALSLRPPNLEACERFLKVHESLAGAEGIPGHEAPPQTLKAAQQTKQLLERMDLKQAFTQLYRLQKTIAKQERPSQGELRAYSALAYALVGPVGSHPSPELAAAWRDIS